LTLGYYKYQILGHIEAVSNRPAASFAPGGSRVLFITTSDTNVGAPDTLAEATKRRVAIWKAIVCTTPQPGGYLQVGPATPLNPSVYGPGVIPLDGFPGVQNDLALPGATPVGLEDAEGGY
jgi:hypothetical protein